MADLSWTVPVMRAGYAGRGLTYLAVAGLSLYAIWRGGEAKGTGSTMESLSTSLWGTATLWLIAAGLLAFALWSALDAWADLDDFGTDAGGIARRLAVAGKGAIYAGLAVLAVMAALEVESSGGGIAGAVSGVLAWPGGWIAVGAAGLLLLAAAAGEAHKGITSSYRKRLAANPFTTNWDWALRAGLVSQGVVIALIGAFFLLAAWTGRSGETGGVAAVFDWLQNRPFGNALVTATCIGFLGFVFFCFVNAAYRVVPKVADVGVETLAAKLKAMA